MKYLIHLFFFLLLSAFYQNCIQKNGSFDDQKSFLTALVQSPTDIPKSFGLDLKIDNRLNRGCETRIGNLMADMQNSIYKTTIAFYAGGNLRDDNGIKAIYPDGIIPKGVVPTLDLIKKFLPFTGGKPNKINIRAFRIKQALESSVSRLNNKTNQSIQDIDTEGPTHGNCWLNPNVSGSGRFLHVSSKLSFEVNPSGVAQAVAGSAASNSLTITVGGKRIVRIIIDGVMIYNNESGDINTGWSLGNSSCVIKGIAFNNSAACENYLAAVEKFQYDGGDSNPSLKPEMLEINNDGSVLLVESGDQLSKDDATLLFEYIQTFTLGPVFPRISNRIIMP